MINYIEKGAGLHEYIQSQGHWLEQRDGEWISSDDVAVQRIIDEYQEPSLSPASHDVDAERDRRIDSGIEFRDVMYQSRSTDRENIAGAAQLAFMAVVGGKEAGDLRWSDPDQDFTWIAGDNSLVLMDAQTVVSFGKAAAERKQQLIFAARQLKDMSPVPVDYTNDKWWP